ncbi:cobalamin trafficking protein CblD-like [Lycorma delicatula]|uniref:cobalamin trafficking protein CblD-like n=1 Tax=Lycorma delicatula TaxID=130591 RepID=UPI003F5128FA
MLNSQLFRLTNNVGGKFLFICKHAQAFYSRRSSSNQSTFKIVTKQTDAVDEFNNSNVGIESNWELLNPHGYRFFLPGSVGLAWTEPSSTINSSSQFLGIECLELDCTVQECPVLLRQGIIDMFPGTDLGNGSVSVITLSQKKTKLKKSQQITIQELEKLTKLFVITASEICVKLKMGGYWADFINPFSGLPYYNPFYNSKREFDKQLTSSGFKIVERNNCRVIANTGSKNVVGNIFTTAPSTAGLLLDLLQEFEE